MSGVNWAMMQMQQLQAMLQQQQQQATLFQQRSQQALAPASGALNRPAAAAAPKKAGGGVKVNKQRAIVESDDEDEVGCALCMLRMVNDMHAWGSHAAGACLHALACTCMRLHALACARVRLHASRQPAAG